MDPRGIILNMKKIFLAVAIFFSAQHTLAESRPLVLVSFGVLMSIAKDIGQDYFLFVNISENSNGHDFEPQPEFMKNLKKAQGLILNGLGYEPWFTNIKKQYSGASLVASEGVSRLSISDPHAWLDPMNGIIYAENIKNFLSRLRPDVKDDLEKKFELLRKKLMAIAIEAKAQFRNLKKRKVVTSHSSFNYLAKALNLTFYSPQGTSAEHEPSAQDLKKIIQSVREEKITALFTEHGIPSNTMETIARETKQKISGVLYSDKLSDNQGPAFDYLSLLKNNFDQLSTALK